MKEQNYIDELDCLVLSKGQFLILIWKPSIDFKISI